MADSEALPHQSTLDLIGLSPRAVQRIYQLAGVQAVHDRQAHELFVAAGTALDAAGWRRPDMRENVADA